VNAKTLGFSQSYNEVTIRQA